MGDGLGMEKKGKKTGWALTANPNQWYNKTISYPPKKRISPQHSCLPV